MDKTISAFCANEQADTQHSVDIDSIGEVVLTCGCGRFIKFPAGTDAATLKAGLEVHKASNEGQITREKIEAMQAALIASL